MREEKSVTPIAARLLKSVEGVVLFSIAVVLVVLAILVLISSAVALIEHIGNIRESAIEIMDSVLLVMMTMEIVYTVTLSIESHILVAEPFLIVGAIAAIRRMLVITAESTKLAASNPEVFQNTLIELGLLAGTIVAIAISIYILRRSQAIQKKE